MCGPPKIKKPDPHPLPTPEKTAEGIADPVAPAATAQDANRVGRSKLRIDLTAPKPAGRPGLQIPV
jgi:hypothetical protein